MLKVLLTGGAGFIGSRLVKRLLQDNSCRVIVIDNLEKDKMAQTYNSALSSFAKLDDKKFAFYREDIRNKEAILDIF